MSIVRMIAFIIILTAAWELRAYLAVLIGVVVLFMMLCFLRRIYLYWARRHVDHSMESVDVMTGLEFEVFVAQVLKANGYTHVKLTHTYDYGVDILARKDGIRWGIQVKRNRGQAKAIAVRQAVTGLNVYNCDQAMVITNSYFGHYAITLAKANNCILIDRDSLYKLLS